MADEGDEIRKVAQGMRDQKEKVNEIATKQNAQRAIYGAMRATRLSGGKSVTRVRRKGA